MNMSTSDRRSLYSHSTSSQENEERFDILGALDQERPGKKHGKRIALVALAMLLTASLFVSLSPIRTLLSAREPQAQVRARPRVPAIDSVRVPATVAVTTGAATILPEETTPSMASNLVKTEAEEPVAAPSPDAAVEPVIAAVDHHIEEHESSPTKEKPRHMRARKRFAAPTIRKGGKSKSVKETDKTDSDVDLIAALLSRVSRSDSAGKNGSEARGASAQHASPISEKEQKRNRDIVVRRPEDSTEALVRRCRELGLIEGELCRIRICSGNWGKESACTAAVSTPDE